MPTGIDPLSVAPHKNLGNAPGAQRWLAVYFGFIQILTVGNCNIAEALNFGARELAADQLSTCCLKLSGSDCSPFSK